MGFYLGVDLGGTNIAAGVVDENYNIIGRHTIKTKPQRGNEAVCKDVVACAEKAVENASLKKEDIIWIGIGAPGTVDVEKGIVTVSNNLNFQMVPLASYVQERMHIPVYLDNDANLAAYGEVLAGAAKGYRNVLVVTLGTGVGGGIIIDGKIYGGYRYLGAEIGHVGMVFEGTACTCGEKGCIEAYCSATALIRQAKEKMEQDKQSLLWELTHHCSENLTAKHIFDAQVLGDKTAKEVIGQYLEYLGYALTGFINLLKPEIILIGGGISHQGERLLAPLRDYTHRHVYEKNPDNRTKIECAKLGNDAGIIGAAFLGRLRLDR